MWYSSICNRVVIAAAGLLQIHCTSLIKITNTTDQKRMAGGTRGGVNGEQRGKR